MRDPRVFVDHGRKCSVARQPALFKRRESLHRNSATQHWKKRLRLDWTTTAPAWSAEFDPLKSCRRLGYGKPQGANCSVASNTKCSHDHPEIKEFEVPKTCLGHPNIDFLLGHQPIPI